MRAVVAGFLAASLLAACQPTPVPSTTEPGEPPAADALSGAITGPATGAPEGQSDTSMGDITHPQLQVTTLDGTAYDLAEHRGKWVVVNFWATWCAPCLKEMPELSALDAMREHVEVIGLAYEEIEPAAMQAFLAKHPVVYPIAIIDTYDPPADFDTPRGLPMTYLIAPDGSVARKILGPVTAQDIEDVIAAAQESPAAKAEAPEKV